MMSSKGPMFADPDTMHTVVLGGKRYQEETSALSPFVAIPVVMDSVHGLICAHVQLVKQHHHAALNQFSSVTSDV